MTSRTSRTSGTGRTDGRVVTSADGTRIAVSVTGSGPALVLVDGAMCHRGLGPMPDLARELADRFTVWTYDRRGRGESGPDRVTTLPADTAVAREVEDLAAVVEAAGGRASVLGASSGAALALEAARAGLPVDRLFLYELPAVVDGTREPSDPRAVDRTRAMLADGDRDGAVRSFLGEVGVPAPFLLLMRLMPAWRRMREIAHTLPHDYALTMPHRRGLPFDPGFLAGVSQPAVVYAGGKSPEYMRNAQRALAAGLPRGEHVELPGQTHMIKAKVLAPAVAG